MTRAERASDAMCECDSDRTREPPIRDFLGRKAK
jgi:hypothetical protein